jgi:hypothetical protein
MDGTCNTRRKKMRNTKKGKCSSESLKGRDHLGDTGVKGGYY